MSVTHCIPWKHRGSITLSIKARVFVVLYGVVTTPAAVLTPPPSVTTHQHRPEGDATGDVPRTHY